MTQFHFNPESYLDLIRAEVPRYDEMQEHLAWSLTGQVQRVLDLGTGTGRTAQAVLQRFPNSSVVLVDQSPEMLAMATRSLSVDRVEQTIVGDLLDALPDGPFDAAVSALAVHHLNAAAKRRLFTRLRSTVGPGGRFVMADVVVPDDPTDAVTPIAPPVDQPDRVKDLISWLGAAGWDASCTWSWKDLAIIVAA